MAVQNSLTKQQQKTTISTYLSSDAVKKYINNMIGSNKGQRLIASIVAAVNSNPQLQECDNSTILAGAIVGESLDLSPSPQLGQFYLVPYKDKKRNCKVAQFQLGYKGYLQLAIRSGYYSKINVLSIKEGELVKFDPLTEEIEVNLIEDEEEREQAETIGYYAMYEYTNGFKKAIYWSKSKMERHANKYSSAFNLESYNDLREGKIPEKDMWKYSSYWYKDFDGMAYKTMLRQLISKWGIMSIEMQKAYECDMGVIDQEGNVDYIDNQPVEEQPIETTSEEVTDALFGEE